LCYGTLASGAEVLFSKKDSLSSVRGAEKNFVYCFWKEDEKKVLSLKARFYKKVQKNPCARTLTDEPL